MRLFVAIQLSDNLKGSLIEAQNEMFDHGVRGRYASEENLHLMLTFIGEYPDDSPVLDALSTVTFTPFSITLDGLGCFGDLWWAGVTDSAPLEAVVRRVRRALAQSGIPFDRKRFSPHITLIRRASGEMPGVQISAESMTVTTISLMRSDQGKNGMIYTEIGTISCTPAAL